MAKAKLTAEISRVERIIRLAVEWALAEGYAIVPDEWWTSGTACCPLAAVLTHQQIGVSRTDWVNGPAVAALLGVDASVIGFITCGFDASDYCCCADYAPNRPWRDLGRRLRQDYYETK